MFVPWFLNTELKTSKAVFWVEAAGICVFGVYWFLKGIEINRTAADEKAATGRLRLRSGTVEEIGVGEVSDHQTNSRPRMTRSEHH